MILKLPHLELLLRVEQENLRIIAGLMDEGLNIEILIFAPEGLSKVRFYLFDIPCSLLSDKVLREQHAAGVYVRERVRQISAEVRASIKTSTPSVDFNARLASLLKDGSRKRFGKTSRDKIIKYIRNNLGR